MPIPCCHRVSKGAWKRPERAWGCGSKAGGGIRCQDLCNTHRLGICAMRSLVLQGVKDLIHLLPQSGHLHLHCNKAGRQ